MRGGPETEPCKIRRTTKRGMKMSTTVEPTSAAVNRPPRLSHHSLGSILLMDTNTTTLQNRASALRRFKVEVVCASKIPEARALWHPGSYKLVLIDTRRDFAAILGFCQEVRESHPQQLIAFFVAGPDCVSVTPDGAVTQDVQAADAKGAGALFPTGGVSEAARQISLIQLQAVRNLGRT